MTDITERNRAKQTLKDSEENFRAMVELFPDAVLVIYDSKISYANPQAAKLFAVAKPEDLIGRDPLDFVPDEERKESIVRLNLAQTQTTELPARPQRIVDAAGGIIEIEANIRGITFEGKQAVLVTSRDITSRKQIEAQLQETARLASIGELAAGVAHEINNPLTSVIGYSQMVLESNPPGNIKEDLQIVRSEAQRAAKVVKNLLLFGRRTGPNQTPADLNAILIQCIELKRHEFITSNIEVESRLTPGLPRTLADEYQLVQVFVNLLTNAQNALTSVNRAGLITVRSTLEGERIKISIEDDGPGIAPEVMPKIFDPFFSTKEVGKGTGLGLSICHGIVNEHHGDIWAESTMGSGATFHVELPVVSSFDHPESDLTVATMSNEGDSKHVLVVDDEVMIRVILRRWLERNRYTVDLATNGKEAWQKLCALRYDCIILDLKMPVMGGQELYRLLRDVDEGYARNVIFITGDTINTDTLDFTSTIDNVVISKPFEIADIIQ